MRTLTPLALLLLPACTESAFYSGPPDMGDYDTGSNADPEDDWDDTGDAGWEDEEGFPMLTPAATDVYVFV
ncbi:MAG: hypothetical protein JXB39_14510, partial [Deltaproteobacteria bacterium]|nr:hypothetical protein [Deltaproteobacteria bacterium]